MTTVSHILQSTGARRQQCNLTVARINAPKQLQPQEQS